MVIALVHRRRQSFRVRGANVKPVSTYTLSKTENSSDLVHYFWGWAPNSQLKIKKKNVRLGMAHVRTERPQSAPRTFTEALPKQTSTTSTLAPSTTSTTLSFFVIV